MSNVRGWCRANSDCMVGGDNNNNIISMSARDPDRHNFIEKFELCIDSYLSGLREDDQS